MTTLDASLLSPAGSLFGAAVTSSDLLVPNTNLLAVGAPGTRDSSGSLWLFSIGSNGDLDAAIEMGFSNPSPHSRYSEFPASAAGFDAVGRSVLAYDVDSDNRGDLVVGAPGDEEAFLAANPSGTWSYGGSVWVLGLDSLSPVSFSMFTNINATSLATTGYTLPVSAKFGHAVAAYPTEVGSSDVLLLVGAPGVDGGDGALLVLNVTISGGASTVHTVLEVQPPVEFASLGLGFASSLTVMPDLDGDGTHEVLVGCPGSDTSAGMALIISFVNMDFDFTLPEGSAHRRARVTTFAVMDSSDAPSELI
jgi:hypothetical protein